MTPDERDLIWMGVPFRASTSSRQPRSRSPRSATWFTFAGLDGYRTCRRLDDALADMLLADRLGVLLTVEHFAPLRPISPANMGYKSVKHV